jgi:hypothetical protein
VLGNVGKCWENIGNIFPDSDSDRFWPALTFYFPCQHSDLLFPERVLKLSRVLGISISVPGCMVLLCTRRVNPCESGGCSCLHSGRVLAQDFTGQNLNGKRWCLAAMSLSLQRWLPDMMAWVRVGWVGERNMFQYD